MSSHSLFLFWSSRNDRLDIEGLPRVCRPLSVMNQCGAPAIRVGVGVVVRVVVVVVVVVRVVVRGRGRVWG